MMSKTYYVYNQIGQFCGQFGQEEKDQLMEVHPEWTFIEA
jgi:hypothetical protein